MNEQSLRQAFEHWYSDDGKNLKAVEKNALGTYVLQQAVVSWASWVACHEAMQPKKETPAVPYGKVIVCPKPDELVWLRTRDTAMLFNWVGDGMDMRNLAEGRIYKTKEDAMAALELLKGEVGA